MFIFVAFPIFFVQKVNSFRFLLRGIM